MLDIDVLIEQVATSYNTLPYDSHAFKWCSPAYIRAVAYLYGVELPPVRKARVLEIGCAAGGNSLPFAFMYPDAYIMGIDISHEQIAKGQSIIDRAQLKNCNLHVMCMTELPDDLGLFDYVIAHGVLSWIPKALQPHLFQSVQSVLHHQSGAYISFNTYPGWKARETLRDVMLWHSRHVDQPHEKINKARETLPFLKQGISAQNLLRPVKHYLASQLPECSSQDYYVAHEYLELHNHPLYLTEMVEAARAAGLKYIGDAEPQIECIERYGLAKNTSFLALYNTASCAVSQQQYIDFAVGRSFRKSLLCSSKNSDTPFLQPDFSRLKELVFAGSFEPLPCQSSAIEKTYVVLDEAVKISCPHVQIMLAILHQSWPRPVSGQDLLRAVNTNKKEHAEQALKQLFFLFPLELCRSYEDLPLCLQDGYRCLIPGVATMMSARFEGVSDMNEFNAWYSSSTEELTETDVFIIQHLEKKRSPLLTANALEQAWKTGVLQMDDVLPKERGEFDKSHLADKYVSNVIDRLHKYAIYI